MVLLRLHVVDLLFAVSSVDRHTHRDVAGIPRLQHDYRVVRAGREPDADLLPWLDRGLPVSVRLHGRNVPPGRNVSWTERMGPDLTERPCGEPHGRGLTLQRASHGIRGPDAGDHRS